MEIQRLPLFLAGKQAEWAKGNKVIGAKGFVWLSGSTGLDPNTGKIPEGGGEQARLAMENIKEALADFGASIKNIVFWRRYIKGEFPNGILNDPGYREIDRALQEFWRENCPEFLKTNIPPASTLVGVSALALPELLLEIEVIAAIE